jgi:hypothetical protein
MSNQVLGFAALLDDSMDSRGRHITAAYRFNEGLLELQNLCPMKLKMAIFVKNWFSFGQYIVHPGEYRPGEKFIIYLELENPTVRKVSDGFEAYAKIDCEIRDTHAKIVNRQGMEPGIDHSYTPKRDYCMEFRGIFPESLPPGQYHLRISVTDLNDATKHYAEEQIPFRIVPALAGE